MGQHWGWSSQRLGDWCCGMCGLCLHEKVNNGIFWRSCKATTNLDQNRNLQIDKGIFWGILVRSVIHCFCLLHFGGWFAGEGKSPMLKQSRRKMKGKAPVPTVDSRLFLRTLATWHPTPEETQDLQHPCLTPTWNWWKEATHLKTPTLCMMSPMKLLVILMLLCTMRLRQKTMFDIQPEGN